MSMGAVILAAGTGERSAYETCGIMIHNLSAKTEGKVNEMIRDVKDFERYNELLVASLAESTGLPKKELRAVMDVDFNLTTAEARNMNLIDKIIPTIHARKAQPNSRPIPESALKRAEKYCNPDIFRVCK